MHSEAREAGGQIKKGLHGVRDGNPARSLNKESLECGGEEHKR